MATNASGLNSFIHVLIFYEEINEAEITSNDFDIVGEILRKQHSNKKKALQTRGNSRKLIEGRDGS